MESEHVPKGQQPILRPPKMCKQMKHAYIRRVKIAAKKIEILKEIGAYTVPTDRANAALVQKYIVGRIREVEVLRRWPEPTDREAKKTVAEITHRNRAIELIAKERAVILPDVNDIGFIIHPTNETATKFELNY